MNRKILTSKKIIDDFIKDHLHNPFLATVGNGGDKIIVYVHSKNHNYKFPKQYKGISVLVRYIGKVKPLSKKQNEND